MEITLKDLVELIGNKAEEPTLMQGSVFIRTVTHYYVGRVVRVTAREVELSEASWVADTGRFNAALATGTLSEVEPFPHGVTINRDVIVDWSPWKHALPTSVK